MSNKVPTSFIIIIGLMLFALFWSRKFNFPPMLGQMAGNNVWIANAGF